MPKSRQTNIIHHQIDLILVKKETHEFVLSLMIGDRLIMNWTNFKLCWTRYWIITDVLGVREFANGPGDLGSIPGRVIPKTQKMVLHASLLNTQHYKVQIKGKVEQPREGVAPSRTLWCSSYRKGSLRVTLDYGRQLYFTHSTIRYFIPEIKHVPVIALHFIRHWFDFKTAVLGSLFILRQYTVSKHWLDADLGKTPVDLIKPMWSINNNKCMYLYWELKKKLWTLKVTVIPIVIGALSKFTKRLVQGLEYLDVRRRVEIIQTTTFLRSARILRIVLKTWGDLLSLKSSERQSVNADVKYSQGVK